MTHEDALAIIEVLKDIKIVMIVSAFLFTFK